MVVLLGGILLEDGICRDEPDLFDCLTQRLDLALIQSESETPFQIRLLMLQHLDGNEIEARHQKTSTAVCRLGIQRRGVRSPAKVNDRSSTRRTTVEDGQIIWRVILLRGSGFGCDRGCRTPESAHRRASSSDGGQSLRRRNGERAGWMYHRHLQKEAGLAFCQFPWRSGER